MERINKLRAKMKEMNLDGVFITKPENRFYLSGFTGSAGYVVITQEDQYFITDFRYKQQAAAQCKGYDIKIHYSDYKVNEIINELALKTLGFEDAELTVKEFTDMDKEVKADLKPMGSLMENIRLIKSEDEVKKIEKAAAIADQAFEHIVGFIKPGLTENDVALELEFFMKKKGATKLSFDSIIASGWRSSLPHGVASDKVIEKGDFVTMDYGCVFEGYCSDMTRTIVMGPASEKQKKIYNTVLNAQEEALKAIKKGVKGSEADKVARDIIEAAGFGQYFGHGLGHGLGLEVHENPRLSPQGDTVLDVNNVVTDEPGIYIPEFGGVRIEDLVVVKEDGCIRLSKSPKHLMEIEC